MRWLAWENMGGGLLAQYLLFPMGSYDDALLTYLRRGEFPDLTRWKNLADGLLSGPKADLTAALKVAISSSAVKSGAEDVVTAVATVPGDTQTPRHSLSTTSRNRWHFTMLRPYRRSTHKSARNLQSPALKDFRA